MTNDQEPRRRRSQVAQGEAAERKGIAQTENEQNDRELRKRMEAQSRTGGNPAEAKDVDPAEAKRQEAALQAGVHGSTPQPQREIPTDNSLPNSDDQYVDPEEEEIESLRRSTAVETAPMAEKAAEKRAKEAAAREAADAPKGARQKYMVQNASIFTTNGAKHRPGDVVELTAAEAKHFNKMGNLAPYIPDDSDDEE